jgi:hypothetical protein
MHSSFYHQQFTSRLRRIFCYSAIIYNYIISFGYTISQGFIFCENFDGTCINNATFKENTTGMNMMIKMFTQTTNILFSSES